MIGCVRAGFNMLAVPVSMAMPISVAISGNDVYVAGSEGNVAKVWKNGVAASLAEDAQANSVAVYGSDVYVAGCEGRESNGAGRVAVVWRNGVATRLTDGARQARANSILVELH